MKQNKQHKKNRDKIKIKSYNSPSNGCLFVGEGNRDIPFSIKRFYVINNLSNPNIVRGGHAHKKLEQVIFCIKGSFDLHLDDGREKWKIPMGDSSIGVRLKKRVWHSMTNFSNDCVILVVADNYYNEKDYIRDYNEFIRYVKNKI